MSLPALTAPARTEPSRAKAFLSASVSASWAQLSETALRKAESVTQKLPVPAILKRHVSQKDAAFILAAYAIPLPGTGLIAAAIVGSRLGYKHWRGQHWRGRGALPTSLDA